ncbi:D-alanine--D-alanine ligase [Candidatus Manganitrophus noduliformans]|nr:D-alanine--D-alanine ligase [Candidatus Manganitrophus noduliformans]
MALGPFLGKRIGVLMGGMSAEREVSLKSGRAIAASLDRLGYTAVPIDVDSEVAQTLRAKRIEIAFNALHGRYGEDGAIQGVLEVMRVPYTGSGILASALGMDKIASHDLFQSHGIPVPPFQVLTEEALSGFRADGLSFGFPVVVKPAMEGSSVGVTIVSGPGEIDSALKEAFQYGPRILIEKYISGMEVQVGILGSEALGAIEIRPKTKFYDYTAKYVPGMSEHLFPAPLPPDVYQKVLDWGLKAHHVLGCTGYSRVDLLVDERKRPYVLEVNTLPGMTETSLLPEIARGVGIDFDALVERILETAGLDK